MGNVVANVLVAMHVALSASLSRHTRNAETARHYAATAIAMPIGLVFVLLAIVVAKLMALPMNGMPSWLPVAVFAAAIITLRAVIRRLAVNERANQAKKVFGALSPAGQRNRVRLFWLVLGTVYLLAFAAGFVSLHA